MAIENWTLAVTVKVLMAVHTTHFVAGRARLVVGQLRVAS
jgi:hypothetical protein